MRITYLELKTSNYDPQVGSASNLKARNVFSSADGFTIEATGQFVRVRHADNPLVGAVFGLDKVHYMLETLEPEQTEQGEQTEQKPAAKPTTAAKAKKS